MRIVASEIHSYTSLFVVYILRSPESQELHRVMRVLGEVGWRLMDDTVPGIVQRCRSVVEFYAPEVDVVVVETGVWRSSVKDWIESQLSLIKRPLNDDLKLFLYLWSFQFVRYLNKLAVCVGLNTLVFDELVVSVLHKPLASVSGILQSNVGSPKMLNSWVHKIRRVYWLV